MKLGNVVAGLLTVAGLWVGMGREALQAASFTVTVGTYFFNPTNLTVMQGDTVIWTNRAIIAHDTTQGASNTPTAQRLWASPNLAAANGNYRFTFTNMGVYPYICLQHVLQHPEQTGTISVISGNFAPAVTLTAPAATSRHPAPPNFLASATATDPDGTVTNVMFTATPVGGGTSLNLGSAATTPYTIVVTNLGPGTYSFRAIATDNLGLSSTSSPPISVLIATPVPLVLTPTVNPLAGQVQIVFPTTQGLSYVLEESTAVTGPWTTISTTVGPPGTSSVTNNRPFDASSPTQRFYRAFIQP